MKPVTIGESITIIGVVQKLVLLKTWGLGNYFSRNSKVVPDASSESSDGEQDGLLPRGNTLRWGFWQWLEAKISCGSSIYPL